jgi:MFS family permease
VIVVAAAWVVGMIAAVPFVLWWARDFGRIPGRTWFWSGYDPRPWRWAVFLGFFLGGVVAIVAVLRWRRSPARDELLAELRERRAEWEMRRVETRPPNVRPLRPRPEVAIDLTQEHGDATDPVTGAHRTAARGGQ